MPVLVRVSYFPNWNVEGAEGPYRIGPNQMVVVPTDTHVKLSYGRSKSDVGFYALTLIGIAGAVFLRRRGDVTFPALSSPEAAAPPPDPDPTPSSIDPIWEDDGSARRELPPPPQGGPIGPDAALPHSPTCRRSTRRPTSPTPSPD